MNTPEILDLARARARIPSDNKLAKALGLTSGRMSLYRTGRRKLDGKTAVKLAELIGVPAAYLLALIAAERAEDETVAKEWRRAARLLKKSAAAAVVASVLALSSPHPVQAGSVPEAFNQSIHYAHRRRSRPGRANCTARPWSRRRRTRQRTLALL